MPDHDDIVLIRIEGRAALGRSLKILLGLLLFMGLCSFMAGLLS